MTDKELKEYRKFMCNKENMHNCKECPENREMGNFQNPCRQQHCWVWAHCK